MTVDSPTEFELCARLADPADNVAIATRRIEAGETVRIGAESRRLRHAVLLGHRFAVRPIARGADLLSWGHPFGRAIKPIEPGEWVCNQGILDALRDRGIGIEVPDAPNFENRIVRYELDEDGFQPAAPTEQMPVAATFAGYRRPGGRGVGTRNYIVILATSSRVGGFVREVCRHLKPLAESIPSIDGIVPVAHTEGGDPAEPNNRIELLRVLAGYLVHPNVGAVLAVDYGVEPMNNDRLQAWLTEQGTPIKEVLHRFYSIRGAAAKARAEVEQQVREWLPQVAGFRRTEEPVAGLSLALQCGGSDAFSGVSGNPLAGALGHELVRQGGRVCLTETDELIGAEEHVLARVKDLETARRFLGVIERFKERLGWHGTSVEGNPSGGNKLRGLYNITLKSLGAAAKKSPLTRLDAVTDYAEPISEPGFTFMDGPGNDLEAIAGQVATGCNLVLFVTGNGSVTNFPFVPTIKVTTTTERHELLRREMDVNAGRFLEGVSMEELRDETFARMLAVASGCRSRGEEAGHSQVSIWRNWRQTDRSNLDRLNRRPEPDGRPVAWGRKSDSIGRPPSETFAALKSGQRWVTDQVGLILPTSLCSSEVARMAAERFNDLGLGRDRGIRRFVALCHTEGCGSSGTFLYRRLPVTYAGYLMHPSVATALVLEHGCEKITNDSLRYSLQGAGIDADTFGWASVQLDGGIDSVLVRMETWFREQIQNRPAAVTGRAGLGALTLGLLSCPDPSPHLAQILADLAQDVLGEGGSVLLPLSDGLLQADAFRCRYPGGARPGPTLAHGDGLQDPGMHIVDTETDNWTEQISALGASGAAVMIGAVREHPRSGHPLVPVLQVSDEDPDGSLTVDGIDLFLPAGAGDCGRELRRLLLRTASRVHRPVSDRNGLTDFQFTRGYLGVTS